MYLLFYLTKELASPVLRRSPNVIRDLPMLQYKGSPNVITKGSSFEIFALSFLINHPQLILDRIGASAGINFLDLQSKQVLKRIQYVRKKFPEVMFTKYLNRGLLFCENVILEQEEKKSVELKNSQFATKNVNEKMEVLAIK